MFQTQKELINNLYYKGYNPNVILCNLKQDRIIRFCSRNDQIASPKNGIYVINFTLEDRRILTKKKYSIFNSRQMVVKFTIDCKNKKINEVEFRYRTVNNSGYMKNFSSIDNINYLLDQNILVYRNYIIGFLFTNYVKPSIEEFSKRFEV